MWCRDILSERERAGANRRVIAPHRAGEPLDAQVHATNSRRAFHDGAEREIDLARLEQPRVSAPRARDDVERHARCFARDRLEERWQDERREKIRCGHDEAPLGGARIEDVLAAYDVLHVDEDAVERNEQRLTSRRERHAATGAYEERIAEELAKIGERMAHRGRRHVCL